MKIKALSILLSLILTLTLISLTVVLTLACKPLYYLDIHALHIPETTGYTISEIKANYDAVIDYSLSFGKVPLEFPTFKYMAIFGTLTGAAGILRQCRKQSYGYLKLTAILTVALPAVIGATVALNWDWTFAAFHELAFNNDYWLFDPATDPVINILPDAYFLHCAVMILVLVILGSLICGLIYRRIQRKNVK